MLAVNLHDLRAWLAEACGPTGAAGARYLSSLMADLDHSVDRRYAVYGSFEGSFNSADEGGVVQVTHLHRYPPDLSVPIARRVGEQKAEAVWRVVEAIDRQERGWPKMLVARILREFRRWNSIGPIPLFSCEYDVRRERTAKITLYAKTESSSRLNGLARRLGIKPPPWFWEEMGRDYDCLGVDVWPDGRSRLKIYSRGDFQAERIEDPALRFACLAIARRHEVHHLMFLKRLSRNAAGKPSLKTILRLENGISGNRICAVKGLEVFGRFLGQIKGLLAGQTIYYLGFDGLNGLELCFRKNQAPWIAEMNKRS